MSFKVSFKAIPRFFLLSILLHGVVIIISSWLNRKQLSSPVISKNEIINLEILEPIKVKKINPAKLDENKRIVDQDKINDVLDPNSKLLSSHNQKVNKETVAKNHGDFQNQKMNLQPKLKKKSEENPTVKQVTLPADIFGTYKSSLAKVLEKQKELDVNGNQAGGEVSRSRDYLPDKDDGLETLLSTREFVYYSYYTRIRNQLTEYWEPKIKQKVITMFRQGRRIASADDHITKLQIILDAKGILMKVQILGASGIQDLDEVAVDAFRAAAPFPNPPKGIIESDGTVKIEWDFVVET